LRNQIYTYVLGNYYVYIRTVETEYYKPMYGRAICSGDIESKSGETPIVAKARAFALVRVCRQIYVEASPMVCALNTFRTDDPYALLRRMVRGQFEAIRTLHIYDPVRVEWWWGRHYEIPSLKATFPSLKRLVVDRRRYKYVGLLALESSVVDYLRRAAKEGVKIFQMVRWRGEKHDVMEPLHV
jgi:hypothetical protein